MRTTLNFVRLQAFNIDALARVTLEVDEEDGYLSKQQVMERLKVALTLWANTSEEGRKAWKQSSEDFNVGDLAHYVSPDKDSALNVALETCGLTLIGVDTDFWHDFDFDTVLMHPDD